MTPLFSLTETEAATNIAHNKPAFASASFINAGRYKPYKAVDGNRSRNIVQGCYHSQPGIQVTQYFDILVYELQYFLHSIVALNCHEDKRTCTKNRYWLDIIK